MTDHLAVLGYLIARRHIRGFSVVEDPGRDLPYSAGILFPDSDEVMLVYGHSFHDALGAALDVFLGGDLDPFDLDDGVRQA